MQLFNSKQSALLFFFTQFFAPFSLPRFRLLRSCLSVPKHIRVCVLFFFSFLSPFCLGEIEEGGGCLAVSALLYLTLDVNAP